MGNTSRTIPAVFAELRRILGNTASTVDTLQFATAVVAFFELKTAPEKLYELDRQGDIDGGWQYFEDLPVDVAMRDGGWKVLEYEYARVHADNTEFRELWISELHAGYMEPYWPAPCDRVEAESLEWLSVSLRPSQIPIDHLAEFILEDLETDDE